MSHTSKPSSPATGCTLFLAFIVLFGLFLDAAWVLGQKAWMHAFGERAVGHLVDTHSYTKKGKNGRPYRVSVHDYQYTDASGGIHVGQTGHKSVLFNRERYAISSGRDIPANAPRVTVLYLRSAPSTSWVVEHEPAWGECLFLAGVIFVPMAIAGLGTYVTLMPGPEPGARRPSRVPRAPSHSRQEAPAPAPEPKKKGKRKKKQRGRAA